MSRMIWFSIFSGCSNSEITALTLDRNSIAILSKIFIGRGIDFQETATACAFTPSVASRRCELTPGIYATDVSHPFSCSYQCDDSHPLFDSNLQLLTDFSPRTA